MGPTTQEDAPAPVRANEESPAGPALAGFEEPVGLLLDPPQQRARLLEFLLDGDPPTFTALPANVKIDSDGQVKVLDFGLAKAFAAESATEADFSRSPTVTLEATHAGVILGTAGYMSPEQASGKRVDTRSDLWSLGVVLFEMLTGQRLFTGETVAEVLASVLKTAPNWDALPAQTPTPYVDGHERHL